MDVEPEKELVLWTSLSSQDRMKRRSQIWIERSGSWQGIAGVWQGVKVLGNGGYGLCGLFKYQGSDESVPRHVVDKQSGQPDKHLQNESRLLAQCGASKTAHIVKMYKSYHQEGGTGTSQDFDPYPYRYVPNLGSLYLANKEVSRIYLEYCSRGDLWHWVLSPQTKKIRSTELNVWRVFDCLARGAIVLDKGHEGNEAPFSGPRPIAHFDLKPNNILIASKDKDHPNLGLFKIWAYLDIYLFFKTPGGLNMQNGALLSTLALLNNSTHLTTDDILAHHATCGELVSLFTASLWTIQFHYKLFQLHFENSDFQPPIRVMGHPLFSSKDLNFSAFFKETLLTCLAWDPPDRPTARQLMQLCKQALDSLSADPSTAPKANISTDTSLRVILKPEARSRGQDTGPRQVGETYMGPGPNIDELNLGPGLSGIDKYEISPLWNPLPPSPPAIIPPKKIKEPKEPRASTMFETAKSVQDASNQVKVGTKRQREDDGDRADTDKEERHRRYGAARGKLSLVDKKYGVSVSLNEAYLRAVSATDKMGFSRLGI